MFHEREAIGDLLRFFGEVELVIGHVRIHLGGEEEKGEGEGRKRGEKEKEKEIGRKKKEEGMVYEFVIEIEKDSFAGRFFT